MRWLRSSRGIVIGSVVLLMLLFLFRPGADRLRTRIVSSISQALGRQVEVGSVHVRLLPRPGFDLENFVVHDDPAFGAEPMLRADEVVASVRLRSLLRGKLEIARLSLTEPSLNLVRNSEGHWNLESILQRSSQIQVAPTGKAPSEKRLGFPYIEASRGRINFKLGAEKKPYALTDADFSLWQDSENSWGTRLQAAPVRTDFNLTDTGVIHVNGTWRRAATLRDTPVEFTLSWERAQLGELSKLAYGNDGGWRGGLRILTTLTGTPANLAILAEASADDFHRYDIVGGGIHLAVQCSGQYNSSDRTLSDIACHAPGPEGAISIAGNAANLFESRSYDVAVTVRGLPIQSVANLVRHVMHGLPDDLTTAGQIDAKLIAQRAPTETQGRWTGAGEISDLLLASRTTNNTLGARNVPFSLSSVDESSHRKKSVSPAETHLDIGSVRIALGRSAPATVRGRLARSGYSLEIQGETELQSLLQAARMVGVPTLPVQAEGSAKVDLKIAGDWSGQAPPKATGTVQLTSVRAQVRSWSAPLQITSADVTLLPDETVVKNITAQAGATWHGSLTIPRPCGVRAECPIHFDLHTDEIVLARLANLLNPAAGHQPWYQFFSSSPGTPYFLTANATGRIAANRIVLPALSATQFSADAELKGGRLYLSKMRADVLGGRHTGEFQADFTASPPQYTASGSLDRISLHQLSVAMHDNWISGSADATYQSSTYGLNEAELFASAKGTLHIDAWDGSLPHIALQEGATPLQIRRLTTDLVFQKQEFTVKNSRLETPDGQYQISGTAGHVLDLSLTREGAPRLAITGTLAEPRVSQVNASETRAALKP